MAFLNDFEAKIYVAGHRGLVGSSLVRALKSRGYHNLVFRTHAELDLCQRDAVEQFFALEKPDYVFLAASKVGGIGANSRYPAEFIYDNLQVATNVIHTAHLNGVRKLLNLGSSCIYPRLAPQPIKENALLDGHLEPTNRAYAVAKIAAIEMCDSYRTQYCSDFISAMPCNLYGPRDNFNLETAHVLPALLRKMVEAKEANAPTIPIWGSGAPLREFLYVDDLADAVIFLMEHFSAPGPINVGAGEETSIKELCYLLREVVGFEGEFDFDTSKPDGTPRKLLDSSRINDLGWTPNVSLREGVAKTHQWFLENRPS